MSLVTIVVAISMALQSYPPPFPRPGVVKLLENEYMVAWSANFVKNLPSPMHKHDMDLAAFYLTGGRVNVVLPDGTVREGAPFEAGRTVFNSRGVVHIEEWMAEGTRAIAMELKDAAGTSTVRAFNNPAALAPDTHRVLLDNERVRIAETSVRAGTSARGSSHAGRLVFLLAPCRGVSMPASAVRTPDGTFVWWVGAGTDEGPTPSSGECKMVEMEVKAAR